MSFNLRRHGTKRFDFINTHIEKVATSIGNIILSIISMNHFHTYVIRCSHISKKFGPIARGVTMMKLLANRREREDKTEVF